MQGRGFLCQENIRVLQQNTLLVEWAKSGSAD
jgi:hypothetical protein